MFRHVTAINQSNYHIDQSNCRIVFKMADIDKLTLLICQLVLAEIVKRSSEVILEIIDMKGAPRRVIDIAIEIEEDVSVIPSFHYSFILSVKIVVFRLLFGILLSFRPSKHEEVVPSIFRYSGSV